MIASSIPAFIQLPFANSAGGGFIRTIPVASQIGIVPGAASYTDGFVPLNATPVASGGIPPDIRDFNGLLKQLSAGVQWQQVGGSPRYSSTFSSAIGGYPAGAILVKADSSAFWISTTDNNVTNPDAAGAGWNSFPTIPQGLPVGSVYFNVTATNPATLLGYGTWVAFGTGRMLVGVDPANPLFNTPEATGGSANSIVVSHGHTVNDPTHTHSLNNPSHAHGVTDPGHAHVISVFYNSLGGGASPNTWQSNGVNANPTTSANTTGVTIQGTTTAVSANAAATGISLNSTGSSGANANYPPFISVYMWKRTA